MDLRNWEFFSGTGNPVVGANVEVREASLTHPNVGGIIASTTTNADGMWEFQGLTSTAKDVKVTYSGKVKWYKGLGKHSVSIVVGDNFTPADENLLKNGGLEAWRGITSFTLGASDTPCAPGWQGKIANGSAGIVTQEAVTVATQSKYSVKLAYTHAANGNAYFEQVLPASLVYGLHGKQITLAGSIKQGVASNIVPYIHDGVENAGAASANIIAFVQLSVTRALVTPSAIRVGFKVGGAAASDTVYFDNIMLVIGNAIPSFTPRLAGNEAAEVDYSMLDRLYSRAFLLGGY